jgi:hypothetical protein
MDDKTELLLDGAKGLRSLADALELAARLLETHDLDALLARTVVQPELSDAKANPPRPEAAKEEKALSLIEVRRILAQKSRDGHTEQVRLLLQKYGAEKLSAIDPSNYRNLVDEADCLGATLEDIQSAVDEKTRQGFADRIPAIYGHHFATSPEDLKAANYAGFLRDIRRLAGE